MLTTDNQEVILERMRGEVLACGAEDVMMREENMDTIFPMRKIKASYISDTNRRLSTPHPIKLRENRLPQPATSSTSVNDNNNNRLPSFFNFKQRSYRQQQSSSSSSSSCSSSSSSLSSRQLQLNRCSLLGVLKKSQSCPDIYLVKKSSSNLAETLGRHDDDVMRRRCDDYEEEEEEEKRERRRRRANMLEKVLTSRRPTTYAEALWNHVTMDPDELPFKVGDQVEVVNKEEKDWWYGKVHQKQGWFPSAFVIVHESNHFDFLPESPEVTLNNNNLIDNALNIHINNNNYLNNNNALNNNNSHFNNNKPHRNNNNNKDNPQQQQHDNTQDNKKVINSNSYHEANKDSPFYNTSNISVNTVIDVTKVSNGATLKGSSSRLNKLRGHKIEEFIATEKEYVKRLRDVVEGYVDKARKREDMFSEEYISTIFGNIEQLYLFSNNFYNVLEDSVDKDNVHLSCVGRRFVERERDFEVYFEYCNNQQNSCELLNSLKSDKKYQFFFEGCRLMQQMIEIPLEGFLLIPIQKICQYPLQLKEILKVTPRSHPDYLDLMRALEVCKETAMLINERKRKTESLEKLVEWQATIEGWQGRALVDDSSEMVHSGEVLKVASNGALLNRVLYLFDNQLIILKKDILWKEVLVYKDRLCLRRCKVKPLTDHTVNNLTVKAGFRIISLDNNQKKSNNNNNKLKREETNSSGYDDVNVFNINHKNPFMNALNNNNNYKKSKKPPAGSSTTPNNNNKTYTFVCKSAEEADRWLCAFNDEELLVKSDHDNGFDIKKARKFIRMPSTSRPKDRYKKKKEFHTLVSTQYRPSRISTGQHRSSSHSINSCHGSQSNFGSFRKNSSGFIFNIVQKSFKK